ncbi:alpha/beta hydrolase [Pendulispora rubella]|uniref:Alpha/beta hydrolase n=1 Tax=Pendulispora rubella TaxID=2741070 RepID=A0ABZ2KT12_9BACT
MNKNDYVGMAVAVVCTAALVGCANAQANPASGSPASNPPPGGPLPSVVLVHGAFADGSGWEGVYKLLKRDGYSVSIVQNSTVTLADDVAVTGRAIAAQTGQVILVGHSYGGAVITEAGNDPKVAALVYIAGYVPDKGESVQTLIGNTPPDQPAPPILPPKDGFLSLDQSKFAAAFAADSNADKAAFMSASQVPLGVGAVSGSVTTPAWRAKPSWYLVPTADKMIPPSFERTMAKRAGATVTEAEGSHTIFIARPDLVASLIEQAATATQSK